MTSGGGRRACLSTGRRTGRNVYPSEDSKHSGSCGLEIKFGVLNLSLATAYILYDARVLENCTMFRPDTPAGSSEYSRASIDSVVILCSHCPSKG